LLVDHRGALEPTSSIGIAGSSFFQRIGGFPKSVQELLDDQQANSHFGLIIEELLNRLRKAANPLEERRTGNPN
jgi:hypothetical protein